MFDEIAELVREHTGHTGPLTPATSLQGDTAICGDDVEDLLFAYAEQFKVDMTGYRWYFHTCEEGFSIGGLFVPSPDRRVQEIPSPSACFTNLRHPASGQLTTPHMRNRAFAGTF
jgi:Protein of unknown function (DUF1493)